MKLAQAEKKFATDSLYYFLQPLRNFLEGDMKTIMVSHNLSFLVIEL